MLNTSGNYTTCQPQTINPLIPISLSIIIFVGFILNCISLWIFWFRVKQWNSTVVLQFNLAISDAIITPAAPLIFVYSLTGHWTFGTFLCQCKVFLLSTHTYGSIYFLTLISVHRYFTVAQSVKRTAWTKKLFITKLCLGVWGCLLLQGLPFFFVLKTSEVHGVTKKCLNFHQSEQEVLYFVWNWVVLFLGALIPFSITLVCYSLLSRHILMMNPMNTLSKVMVSKSIQTIFISLIIFIICYIPPHVTRAMGVTLKLFFPALCSLLDRVEVAYYIIWILSQTNCLIDPILYCFASDRFRHTFTGWCSSPYSCGNSQRSSTGEAHSNQVESASLDHRRGPLPTVSSTEMEILVSHTVGE
ncbi:P2Y purinoceptor 4-like [Pseudophryne corroboree]|uniref:P2Y purinoceptor 4-like n=1 Tax=Pseudophryne corroboree TaxID=495146 RepID=UPI003081423F